MCEFYGATEGNICFMNHTGKIGSVGRTNFFYKVNNAFSTGNTLRSTNSCLELKLLPCEHFFFFYHSFEAEVSVCKGGCGWAALLWVLQTPVICLALPPQQEDDGLLSLSFQVQCLRVKRKSWASLFSFPLSLFLPLLLTSDHLYHVSYKSSLLVHSNNIFFKEWKLKQGHRTWAPFQAAPGGANSSCVGSDALSWPLRTPAHPGQLIPNTYTYRFTEVKIILKIIKKGEIFVKTTLKFVFKNTSRRNKQNCNDIRCLNNSINKLLELSDICGACIY